MADAGGVRAGRAFVEIGANDSALRKALAAAQKRLEAFGKNVVKVGAGLAGLGTATLTPLLAMAGSFANAGSELNDMSTRTGASVEALSALGYAAKQTGADIETVETGIKKAQKAVVEAGNGSKEAAENLARLGLSAKQLQDLTPDQQFEAIADALNKIADPTQKAAAAMAIFGKSGTKLIPLAAEMRTLTAEAYRLGLVMSTEDAKAADALGDSIDTLHAQAGALKNQIGAALAPVLIDIARKVQDIAGHVIAWVRENRQLVVTVAKFAAIAIGMGTAIAAVGAGFILVGKVIGLLIANFTVISTVIQGIGLAFAALISPMGLTIVAITALGGALLYYTGAGAAAIEWLKDKFSELSNFVGYVAGGIRDALTAGDITLAAQILWTSLKLAWTKGILELNKLWVGLKTSFLTTLTDATAGALVVWENVINAMQTAWLAFSAWHQNTVASTANWIAKRWAELQGFIDSTFDVTKAKADIDAMSDQEHKAIDEAHAAKLAANEAEHADALAKINEQADAKIKALKAAGASDTSEIEKELADLQSQLAAKIAAAKGKGAASGETGPATPALAAAAVATTAAVVRRVGNAGADRFGSAGALSSQGRSQQEQRERKALQIAEESKRILTDIERRLRDKVEPQTVKI